MFVKVLNRLIKALPICWALPPYIRSHMTVSTLVT